jgi:hypothetical protein
MDHLQLAPPKSLARLLEPEDEHRGRWGARDLADVLRHQMQAPLLFGAGGGGSDVEADDAAGEFLGPLRNFGDLFSHPRPPLSVLRLTKEFGKADDWGDGGVMPTEVGTVLYYAAIVVALLRHGERISRLTDAQLLQGINWALRQPWLDESTRKLFAEGRVAAVTGRGEL